MTQDSLGVSSEVWRQMKHWLGPLEVASVPVLEDEVFRRMIVEFEGELAGGEPCGRTGVEGVGFAPAAAEAGAWLFSIAKTVEM